MMILLLILLFSNFVTIAIACNIYNYCRFKSVFKNFSRKNCYALHRFLDEDDVCDFCKYKKIGE